METIWKEKPSQITNLGQYIILVLVAVIGFYLWTKEIPIGRYFYKEGIKLERKFLLVPIFSIIVISLLSLAWKMLTIYCWSYEITEETLFETKGVLSQKKEATELYRIKDYSVQRPFFLRIFGLSTLVIFTSDISDPTQELRGINNGEETLQLIRAKVEEQRRIKGVREFD
jgi:uncharacterized membrane protein YdbT with pleckstrin-like domain